MILLDLQQLEQSTGLEPVALTSTRGSGAMLAPLDGPTGMVRFALEPGFIPARWMDARGKKGRQILTLASPRELQFTLLFQKQSSL